METQAAPAARRPEVQSLRRRVLVVVHPDDTAAFAAGQAAFIDAFAGRRVVLLFDGRGVGRTIQPVLRGPVGRLVERKLQVLTVSNGAFGNQRGLPLPIDSAIAIMKVAGLMPERDEVLLTGCRGGDRPSSVHLLAEGFAALRIAVQVDPSVAPG